MTDWLALFLIFHGVLFFFAGSLALLRMPDLFCRLHALAKADNVGLALITVGVVLLESDAINSLKMLLIWLLILAASSISSHLIARRADLRRDHHE